MNAIITKFICPTDFKGSRISARIYDGDKIRAWVILPWDDSLSSEQNHIQARKRLQNVLADKYETIMGERDTCPWLTENWASADLNSLEMVHVVKK